MLLVALGAIGFLIFYRAPSCMDTKQNHGETGIDCGGPCQRLCTVSVAPPSVRFARPLTPVSGRTDVVAYIENKNADAQAKAAHFTIDVYGPDNLLIARKEGTVDLPPSSLVPIFVPRVLFRAAAGRARLPDVRYRFACMDEGRRRACCPSGRRQHTARPERRSAHYRHAHQSVGRYAL